MYFKNIVQTITRSEKLLLENLIHDWLSLDGLLVQYIYSLDLTIEEMPRASQWSRVDDGSFDLKQVGLVEYKYPVRHLALQVSLNRPPKPQKIPRLLVIACLWIPGTWIHRIAQFHTILYNDFIPIPQKVIKHSNPWESYEFHCLMHGIAWMCINRLFPCNQLHRFLLNSDPYNHTVPLVLLGINFPRSIKSWVLLFFALIISEKYFVC